MDHSLFKAVLKPVEDGLAHKRAPHLRVGNDRVHEDPRPQPVEER
jgi:hypothetical protein